MVCNQLDPPSDARQGESAVQAPDTHAWSAKGRPGAWVALSSVIESRSVGDEKLPIVDLA
jgi:hypothetical protein